MDGTKIIKGFKVFNPDWTCEGKQYSCPGIFVEDVNPSVCDRWILFCKNAVDCFNYCNFDPKNHVAEVYAPTDCTVEDGNNYATKRLEVVREISWPKLLEIVGCPRLGDWSYGDGNHENRNRSNHNSGDCNSGTRNSGDCNGGNRNSGNRNSGDCNSGDWNSGDCNSGNLNSGNHNSGSCNNGDWNSGDYNSGDWNSGTRNSGDWNKCSFSNGCFNTVEPKIYLFNKPSEWTYRDWLNSDACYLLNQIQGDVLEYVWYQNMTDEEKEAHPEAEVTSGYLKQLDNSECGSAWWHGLSDDEKAIIKAIPNFDREIFKEITGIDVEMEY